MKDFAMEHPIIVMIIAWAVCDALVEIAKAVFK